MTGLALFGLPFAVNSSLHSYLILAYAGSEKAAEDVGFYYAANAAGRLIGILLSGALYQAGGIVACLSGSAAMLLICWLTTLPLPHVSERRAENAIRPAAPDSDATPLQRPLSSRAQRGPLLIAVKVPRCSG